VRRNGVVWCGVCGMFWYVVWCVVWYVVVWCVVWCVVVWCGVWGVWCGVWWCGVWWCGVCRNGVVCGVVCVVCFGMCGEVVYVCIVCYDVQCGVRMWWCVRGVDWYVYM